jgi:hypothetical protein
MPSRSWICGSPLGKVPGCSTDPSGLSPLFVVVGWMGLPGMVNIQETMEHHKITIEIVNFPMNSMVICHSYVTVY